MPLPPASSAAAAAAAVDDDDSAAAVVVVVGVDAGAEDVPEPESSADANRCAVRMHSELQMMDCVPSVNRGIRQLA